MTALMERHGDTPMDFADATLALLAEALDVQEIFTLDRRGLAAYETRDDKPLINVFGRILRPGTHHPER